MGERAVLTVDECAEYLGISRKQAYFGVHKRDIPSIRVGNRILVPRAALDKMLVGAGSNGKQE